MEKSSQPKSWNLPRIAMTIGQFNGVDGELWNNAPRLICNSAHDLWQNGLDLQAKVACSVPKGVSFPATEVGRFSEYSQQQVETFALLLLASQKGTSTFFFTKLLIIGVN